MNSFLNKKSMLLFLSILCILASCSKKPNTNPSELEGSWKVAYYIDKGQKISKSDLPTWKEHNGGDITVRFTKPNGSNQGSFSGVTVTNVYNGDFTATHDGDLSIESYHTTYINEPRWTELYRLNRADRYEIDRNTLKVYFNGDMNSIVFERL